MALEISWSDEANDGLDEIVEYISSKWSDRELANFFIRLEECLEQIKEAPQRNKDSLRKNGVKEFQHSPQTTIFYTYDDSKVYILRLWLNAKDNKRLK